MELFDLETIEGLMSPKECCEGIRTIGFNLLNDQSSTLINEGRAISLKSLADLFLEYNKKLIEYNQTEEL